MDLKRIADEAKNGVVETNYGNGKLKSRETCKDVNLTVCVSFGIQTMQRQENGCSKLNEIKLN